MPFYYPLDRPIDEYQWYTPNMYYYDVSIFHKTEIWDRTNFDKWIGQQLTTRNYLLYHTLHTHIAETGKNAATAPKKLNFINFVL